MLQPQYRPLIYTALALPRPAPLYLACPGPGPSSPAPPCPPPPWPALALALAHPPLPPPAPPGLQISGDIQRFGYFESCTHVGVVRQQGGVMRVNCIDCLDRTNVMQGVLARQVCVRGICVGGTGRQVCVRGMCGGTLQYGVCRSFVVGHSRTDMFSGNV